MRLSSLLAAACFAAAVNASAADIKSISRLAAGPGNVLFVADWKAARVHALTLPAAMHQGDGSPFNILDLEPLLSKHLGGARLTIEDMVVRPGTGEVYVAASYGAAKTPALLRVTSDKAVRRIVPTPVRFAGFQIPDEFVLGYGLDFDEYYRNLDRVVSGDLDTLRGSPSAYVSALYGG